MMKRMVSALALGIMLVVGGSNVYAAEEIVNLEKFVEVDEQSCAGKERVSWGKGELYVNTSESTPYGYAVTKTHSGFAYELTAQVALIDNDGYSDASVVTTAYNSSYTSSALLKSRTKKCEFIGYHSIKDTNVSNKQTCSTYYKVN